MDTIEQIESTDRAVAAETDARRHPLVRAAGALSEIADQPPLRALTLGVLAVGLVRGDARLARAGARMLATHTLATWIKARVKARVDRTRPDEARAHGYRAQPGDSDAHELSSFPSGHTAGALAVALAAARAYPAARTPALLTTVAIAAVQLPRAKHFLSDVLAGAVVGWAADALTPGKPRAH